MYGYGKEGSSGSSNIKYVAMLGALGFTILGLASLDSGSYETHAADKNNANNNSPKTSEESDGCTISPKWPKNVRRWCPGIMKYSKGSEGLEPDLTAGMILQESSGNPNAIGPGNELGLLQIHPDYHDCATSDPANNIKCGTSFMKRLIEKNNGNIRLALIGYNGGEYYADVVEDHCRKYASLKACGFK